MQECEYLHQYLHMQLKQSHLVIDFLALLLQKSIISHLNLVLFLTVLQSLSQTKAIFPFLIQNKQ